MTEHPIVPLELPKDKLRPRNKLPKNRLVLNLKSNGVELSLLDTQRLEAYLPWAENVQLHCK
ncbi:Putative uncharacterized protein [Lactobacillus equicursoris DSM 19284 = JCM 14600 = CIP 110162]|uniref:hypothetical protein n=1 Tax=Lactobacillus equicursoris TaxID=420645 RepID=UPI000283FCCA|nr:hypothetical protein [Lactobacillus equicursoris]CCK85532.1 Putative uncharacterized protein [Lactobacillus equicursoris DSM 19284 = JCM 14600 = CIP 110162]